MKVNCKKNAWIEADKLFPTDYMKDENKSERAGYDIYTSTADCCDAYICDLGNRLEVNLENGESINIWIEEDEPTNARIEKTVSIECTITEEKRGNKRIEEYRTEITFSAETKFCDISDFENELIKIIRKARNGAKKGAFVSVRLNVGKYRICGFDFKQLSFESWFGYGDCITADGVHLCADERYNVNLEHDLWLTADGGKVFGELTI